MSDPTPKLYVLTLVAVRENTQDTKVFGESVAHSLLAIQTSQKDAEDEGWEVIFDRHPKENGWFEHQVTAFELPPRIDMDDYHLTFTITKAEV